MGSSGAHVLQIAYDGKRTEVVCGCFRGTLKEAKAEIKKRGDTYAPGALFLKEFKIIDYLINGV